MRHRIEAGQETYAVLVADAPDGRGDLYAMTGVGSDLVQLTFTLPAEWRPRLSPSGDVVAFLRSRDQADTLRTTVWLLNLLNGAERQVVLPDSSGTPRDLAWADDGQALLVQAGDVTWSLSVPPAPPSAARLDSPRAPTPARSGFPIRVGTPTFATIAPCADGIELCVYPDSGQPAALAAGAREAFRWGGDSVAYVLEGAVVVRPLGPGRSRSVRWREGLRNPREFDAFVPTGPRQRATP
jgi:hypothetical protein